MASDEVAAGPFGDLDPEEFRRHGHEVVDWIAGFLAVPERYPVLARVKPGDVRGALPGSAPDGPEPLDRILADFERVILPGITHWNHPGFFAYFAISGSAPGILGELLCAALNVNACSGARRRPPRSWKSVVLDWLRKLLDLPAGFRGVIYDTASISTLWPSPRRARPPASTSGSRGWPVAPTSRASGSTRRSRHTPRWRRGRSCSAWAGKACARSRPTPSSAWMTPPWLARWPKTGQPAGGPSPCARRSGQRGRRALTRCRRSPTSQRGSASGSMSTPRTAALRPSCPSAGRCWPGAIAPTRSSSIRTSGSSRPLTARPCSAAAPTC